MRREQATGGASGSVRLILLCLLLLGCSREQMVDRVSYPEDRALALAAIGDLERGDANALAAKLPPGAAETLVSTLPAMREVLPPPPRAIKAVEALYTERLGSGETKRQAYLAYEIAGGERFALVSVGIFRDGSSAWINNFHISPLEGSAASLDAFTLTDKGIGHWLFLLLPLAVLAITVIALVRVWRSGRFRRRWLWSLGCLVGLMRISMEWSSGQILLQPFFVQLFSVGAYKPALLASWMISVSLPPVAIWALVHGRRRETSPVAATFD